MWDGWHSGNTDPPLSVLNAGKALVEYEQVCNWIHLVGPTLVEFKQKVELLHDFTWPDHDRAFS